MKLVLNKIGNRFYLAFVFLFLLTGCEKNLKETSVSSDGESNLQSLTALAKSSKKNIVFILSDDVGYDIPTYNGGGSYETPNLDFMAANGVQFPNFYSHPDGGPSRLAALTGKYSFRNYIDWGYLPPDSKTFGNMLKDAGYATCFVGKWQMDGGDASIRGGGFDKYLAFLPYQPVDKNDNDQYYRRYKNPLLYENGQYLPDSAVAGKYSEDMFISYSSKFIDSNKNKPFLLFYSCNLVQKPWSPTPDDADFAGWNPATDDEGRADKKYFPSMVKYMDKTVGQLISKITAAGLLDNTVFIFTSDNTTNRNITSIYNGVKVKGGKNYTTRIGINVPLVCYGSTKLLKNKKDTSLADMTDFMPTMADIAGIPLPTTYGPLDGTTFADNLSGVNGKQRKTVFCHWKDVFTGTGRPPLQRYTFDYKYKLYDSINGSRFYNLRLDPSELNSLPNGVLTPAEVKERNSLQAVMDKMHN